MFTKKNLIISAVIICATTLVVWAVSAITDSFTDTSKVYQTSNITVDTGSGQIKLSQITWTCGDTLTDTRDSKTYTTVLIGSQCWMAQNLNVGTRVNGSGNQGTDCSSASAIQKYCYSNNDANCTTYGGLYQWNQTMCGGNLAGAQGICPLGWHIPTHDEFTTLERTVCASGTCATDFPYNASTAGWQGTNEGTKLKSGGSSGFNGLLAGHRNTDGSFSNLSSFGFFWSSLESGGSAWSRRLDSGYTQVVRYSFDRANGFSVRCLKN